MVKLWNGYRASQTAAEGIKAFGSIGWEIVNSRVQLVVLQIFEQASVKPVGSAFCDEGDVAKL